MLSGIGMGTLPSSKKSPKKFPKKRSPKKSPEKESEKSAEKPTISYSKAKPSTQKDRRRHTTAVKDDFINLTTYLPKSETFVHNGGYRSERKLGTIEDNESAEQTPRNNKRDQEESKNRSDSRLSLSNATYLKFGDQEKTEETVPYSDTTSDEEEGDGPKILSLNMLKRFIKININRHLISSDMQR